LDEDCDEPTPAGIEKTGYVKVTIILFDGNDAAENRTERLVVLGEAWPVLTIVIAYLTDPRRKIENEKIACE